VTPTREEFIHQLSSSVAYCQQADDAGSVDQEMARWQKWVSEWDKVLEDEE